jgi:hypothetical protein
VKKAQSFQRTFCIILAFCILLACNFPYPKVQNHSATDIENEQYSIPTQTLRPTQTITSKPVLESRCSLYSADLLSLYVLSIYPGDASVLIYTEFTNPVIGLEDQYDDGFPWEYSASIGESTSVWCNLFDGEVHSGRLYCMLPFPSEYRNTAQPFYLFVNGCETPIFSVAKQSVMIEKSPSAGGNHAKDHSAQLINICGDQPPDYPACNPAHEDWCYCMGGYYTCEMNTVFIPIKGTCNGV